MRSSPPAAAKPGAAHQAASAYYPGSDVPTDLPSIISEGVAASVQSAVAAINPDVNINPLNINPERMDDFEATSPSGASVRRVNGLMVASSPGGATVTVYPADAQGRRKIVARAASGATTVTYAAADDEIPGFGQFKASKGFDKAIKIKATNVTPEYILDMRTAAPSLGHLDVSEYASMKAVGVTPDFARDLVAAGFPDVDFDELVQARAVGVSGGYVRSLKALGRSRRHGRFRPVARARGHARLRPRARSAGVNVGRHRRARRADDGRPTPARRRRRDRRPRPAASETIALRSLNSRPEFETPGPGRTPEACLQERRPTMTRCIAFLLALVLASLTVSSACLAADPRRSPFHARRPGAARTGRLLLCRPG